VPRETRPQAAEPPPRPTPPRPAPTRRRSRSSRAPARARAGQAAGLARALGRWLLAQLGALAIAAWRAFWRWYGRLTRKARIRFAIGAWIFVLTAPIWLINTAVAYYGRTVVFPLSPFFLREKLHALASYATHRPVCAFLGHPDVGPLIAQAEVRQRLPRGLLAAIVQVESAGKPHRISPAGAMGLGQLMPDTARMLGVSDPFDTEQNIDGASRLMASHLARFRRRLPLAIAAYNAGPGAVRGRVPDNGQTPEYVARVLRTYGELRPRSELRPRETDRRRRRPNP
jgi:soluble lytic murein transglycosylase-like protein